MLHLQCYGYYSEHLQSLIVIKVVEIKFCIANFNDCIDFVYLKALQSD